jgi:hypothetical protein
MKAQLLSRRTFLRGSGVAMALPLLDAMLPGISATGGGAAAPAPRRFVAVHNALSFHAPYLIPRETGRNYTLTPYLRVLEAHRDQLTVFSGLSHTDVAGGHVTDLCFLTGAVHPTRPSFRNTISLDQMAAERLRFPTRIRSLTLSSGGGGPPSLSWSRSGVAVPPDLFPSQVFARLFLDGSQQQRQDQIRRLRAGQSIMDTVSDHARRVQREVGKNDQERLDEYFSSVREVEQSLGRDAEWAVRPKPRVNVPPPSDITVGTDTIGRSRLMYDLMHLALQTDSTRVITLKVGGLSTLVPVAGTTIDWHGLSHHARDPEKLTQLQLIETEHMKAFNDFLTKLKNTREEGQTLLDRTMCLIGSSMGNASSHDNRNLPIVLVGGGFRHGSHLAFDQTNNMPLCNLFLTLGQRLGLEINAFGTSTGTLRGLEVG